MKKEKRKKMCLFILIMVSIVCAARGGEKQVDVNIILDQKIPMRDGIRLSARIWLPEEMPEPLPVVFVFTPYISDESQNRGMFFAKNGYVYTSVDVRGRGNSEGIFFPLEGDKHSKDMYDIVNWLAGQPWCDGRVVMRGGSYRGMVQWQAMKTRPKPLKTIVPSDPVCPGIDFPMHRSVFFAYAAHWLALTSGVTGNDSLFDDYEYWLSKYLKLHNEHVPFYRFWQVAGIEERIFKRWLAHPYYDDFWRNFSPAPADYRDIRIPVLSITCYFFGDQPGAMAYYRNFMKYTPAEVRKNHYLIIGPWDHGGTRYPQKELFGLTFADNAVLDMEQLHLEWYDWHLKGKKRPEFLEDRVCYYVMGQNRWKYAACLDDVYNNKQSWYLSSNSGSANDVFNSGKLLRRKPGSEKPDRFEYDPIENTPGNSLGIWDPWVDTLTDQTEAMSEGNLIYHSPRLPEELEVSGFVEFHAYVSLNVPDTDIQAILYEIKPNGESIFLNYSIVRARYRNSISKPELVKPGEINLYKFDNFDFFSRMLGKGSRLRLVVGPVRYPFFERNYNSGGVVAEETAKDARKAVIILHHDKNHPSVLILPVYINKAPKKHISE